MSEAPLLLPYRTTWEVRTADAELHVLPVIRQGLIDRGLDADIALAGGTLDIDGTVITTVTGSEAPLDWYFGMTDLSGAQFELTLTRAPELLAIEASDESIISHEMIRKLMIAVGAADGGSDVSISPISAGVDVVPKLADQLLDHDRRLPIVVAGHSHELGAENWQRQLRDMTRDITGMASVYLLDEEATAELSTHLHPNLHVTPASIRVFMPRVADDGSGERRHRLFKPTNWVGMYPAERRRALRQAVTLPRPDAHTVQAKRVAERLEKRRAELAEQMSGLPSQRRQPVIETVVQKVADESVLAELDQARAELREKAEQLFEVRSDYEDLQGMFSKTIFETEDQLEETELNELAAEDEARRVREELIQLQRHAEYLQKELAAQGNTAAWEDPNSTYDITRAPETMTELVDRLPELSRYVVFTGDTTDALDLDNIGQMGRFAARSWDVLLALHDYAKEQTTNGFDGGVYNYLTRTPSGCHSFPIANFSSSESDTVLKSDKLSRERIFPVPEKVSPSSSVLMHSHFRVARWRSVSPRLYFYDDVANTGKVYVGYLGRHLTNTQT